MKAIVLTNEELYSLYKLLDQLNVQGISAKQMLLTILIKLEAAAKTTEEETPTSSSVVAE